LDVSWLPFLIVIIVVYVFSISVIAPILAHFTVLREDTSTDFDN